MSAMLRDRPVLPGPAGGGVPARRAVARSAWRLFRREWRQQILVLALLVLTAEVDSVSCGSAGNCAAGGLYVNGLGNAQGFVVGKENGVWGQAINVPGLAALSKGQYGAVNSVSCAPAGGCAAGGDYRRLHQFHGFVT
jgi:hypothetical protein